MMLSVTAQTVYSASSLSLKSPFCDFLVMIMLSFTKGIYESRSAKHGEDLCVSFLDMHVKSEEPESFAAIVTGANVTGGNFAKKLKF